MVKKQTFYPKDLAAKNVVRISEMGRAHSEGIEHRENGWRWCRYQVSHADTFSLVSLEGFYAGAPSVRYLNQEDYIKIHFWLSGKRTTVLNGYGQREHERPEVFITCGPRDMIKVDLMNPNTQVAQVCLCVRRDFFPMHLGLAPEDLPEPLRSLALARELPFGFNTFGLTPSLVASTRAILAAPFAVRNEPAYAQAKAVELMCLQIDQMARDARKVQAPSEVWGRRKARLYEARERISRDYARPITLEGLAREVGLNKMALSSGFRELFGMSVYDCLQKERMEHAYELLQDKAYAIKEVAEAVGYTHACNFSTAFRAFYGCTPQQLRLDRH